MSNNLNKDLTGKKVVLSAKYYKGTDEDRTFFCESGFGCKPYTNGRGVYGYFVKDGEEHRAEGYEIESLI